ncbi:uncharacterized protein [Cicer arietinum]|uniref:uncharacterized protein isoform X3 n=1 Tax=Cicer arietinum TaxID=3827 RepID=UPI003CC613AA
MVFVDVKGDRIHVVVPKDYVAGFKDMLKEHTTYIMHNCSVVDNDDQFKVCDHRYKLMFNSGTTLTEEKLDQIPSHVYNFKSFGDILSGKCQSNLLVDVIGVVHEVTFTQREGVGKKVQASFNMKDLRNTVVSRSVLLPALLHQNMDGSITHVTNAIGKLTRLMNHLRVNVVNK